MIQFSNNTYSPFTPFDFYLFFVLEVLTVIIECSALWYMFGRYLRIENKGKIEQISYIDCLIIAFTINMISAILGVFVWSLLGVGIQ